MTTENRAKDILIYPELAAKVLQNNESELFIIWSLLKTLDTKGSGVVLMSDILEICKKVLGLNLTYAYSKITKGIDKYWRKPKGTKGNKAMGLLSFKSLCTRLQPDLTRCNPIVVPLSYFTSGTSDCKFFKNFLIGCVGFVYKDYVILENIINGIKPKNRIFDIKIGYVNSIREIKKHDLQKLYEYTPGYSPSIIAIIDEN